VAVPGPLLGPLTYVLPPGSGPVPAPGCRVRVPLGRRRVTGVVLGPAGEPPGTVELRPVLEVLDPPDRPALPPDVLATALHASRAFVAPVGEAVRAALPSALEAAGNPWIRVAARGRQAVAAPGAPGWLGWLAGRPGGRARERTVLERIARELPRRGGRVPSREAARRRLREARAAGLVEVVEEPSRARGAPGRRRVVVPAPALAGGGIPDVPGLTPARRRVLEAALAGPPRPAAALARDAGCTPGVVRALVEAGLLEVREEELPVAGLPEALLPVGRPERLTPDQERAVGTLLARLDDGEFHGFLLHGITGSGKTEVYLRAAEHALALGRGVLILVPEIGLTPGLARSLGERLGREIAVLHSGMGDRRRLDAWEGVRSGKVRVVVGARSALFAPLEGVGLIVVDEEHDPGYKQEETPRYHARDLALRRGREAGAVVVLGSATPSMEAWHWAREGYLELLELPERVGGGRLAEAELVDMREEFRETGSDSPLSRRLVGLLEEALGRGEQAMVLRNRRGFSGAVLCRSCGEAIGCPRCSIALTWHKAAGRLRCHYCGHAIPRPAACPSCGSPHLADVGTGTQRVEELLQGRFPGARVERLDRDTARSPRRLAEVLERFSRGEIDVLVGTQMIAKGHHFPRVTVVGVLSADSVLRLPDFRAAERTFQLLAQVAGRAGRGELPGRVVIQAFRPDHPALVAARDQDFHAFAERELAARKVLRYPPVAAFANVLVRHRDRERALELGAEVARAIRERGEGYVTVLGPTFAPLARLRDRWRVQLIVRASRKRRLVDTLWAAVRGLAPGDLGSLPGWLVVDVDPVQLL